MTCPDKSSPSERDRDVIAAENARANKYNRVVPAGPKLVRNDEFDLGNSLAHMPLTAEEQAHLDAVQAAGAEARQRKKRPWER